jgi:hypothetical protein
VDYALCDTGARPRTFLEVKRVGQSEGGDRQLFEYAFHVGVPLAVLTDGQEWTFYLPGEEGNYEERRVYKLDLLERESSECAERLARYLAHDRVVSGEALEAGRADYRDAARIRQIEATLPKAWHDLLKGQDSILVELVADKVEDLCGYKPDPDTCSRFLTDLARSGGSGMSEHAKVTTFNRNPPPTQEATPGQIAFTINGKRHTVGSAREVMLEVLRSFSKSDASFLDRFAARKHGRKRRYVARDRSELYPGRSDLCEAHAVELQPGWWMGTNYSKGSISDIINLACEVAGVRFGDLHLNLG